MLDCFLSCGDDSTIDNAARVSYGGNGIPRSKQDTANLLRYLMRNRHTSPFEMVELLFHLKMPIFVMRQHVRHRTACLSGSTVLDFDLGGSVGKFHRFGRHPITVKEIYDRWTYGGFGNRREDYDLSFIDPGQYYTVTRVGEWFKNRKPIADSQGMSVKMRAKNGKVIDHYKGSDVLAFYESQKKSGVNIHRDILKQMSLRSIDEDTKQIYHTKISDIWKTGEKPVYEISVGDYDNQYQRSIKASKDHLFFTENGWKRLEDITIGDKLWLCSSHLDDETAPNQVESSYFDEVWVPCYQYEEHYLISSYGRIRRIKKSKGSKIDRVKKLTHAGDRLCVGLSKNGKTLSHQIHRMVLLSFEGKSKDPSKDLCCHKNGNPLDNRIDNLYWGDARDNAHDSINHDTRTRLKGRLVKVKSKELIGVEDTFDVEVTGPFHNFSANSFIVHNSLNEYSGRYSEMSNEFYFPDESRAFGQSQSNKQQSEGDIAKIDKDAFFDNLEHQYQSSYFCYKSAINSGVSKELARIQLPLANYTEIYWKIDLHNFFHYIGLRNDPSHAQSEIVQLARLMYELVKPHVPISCQAFEDYRYNGVTFSVQEQQALAELLKVDDLVMGSMDSVLNSYLKGRELNEFKNKLTRIIERK